MPLAAPAFSPVATPLSAIPSLPSFDSLPEAAVLSAPPAPVSTSQALTLLQRHYGIQADLQALTGERDANFLVGPHVLPDGQGHTPRRLMLKISHPVETTEVADFQTQALLHLARHHPAQPVQRLLPTRDGAFSAVTSALGERPRVVRLFSYLEGLPMPQAPHSPGQQVNVAQTLARLDKALAGLPPQPAGQRRLPWDIQHADSVRSLVALIAAPERRACVARALDRFASHVQPRLKTLRRQAIHNDFNIYNLLVDPLQPDRVCGILDFGDMVEGPLIDDVAVAASYQLDETGDALQAIAEFARAYHAIHPLTPDELALLPGLIRARLAMVVCIGGWRAARDPGNADYILRNNRLSWARLTACDRIDDEQASLALRSACGLAPV